MLKWFDDRDNMFLFVYLSFGIMAIQLWGIYYILHCYLTDNMWWGNSFEWFGTVLRWMGL